MADTTYFVTTPIYYISGKPHIGHVYTTVAADVLARTAKTGGNRGAFLLTGTDEHGQKVANAAAAAGKTPQAWTDELVPVWKELCTRFGVHYDDFIRTTEPRHERVVVSAFERLRASGDIFLGTYEGWYCTNDETFWLESKLIDGRCPNPECRREVQWLSEQDWFFGLSKYRDRLLAYYQENPQWVRPQSVANEMIATIESGLEDLCISRSGLDWGVPLPGGGVMYVWLDALLNYVSATGYDSDPERFATLWPADVQLVGKDIARFHAVIWPAVLWALDLPAPRKIYAHGWLTVEGEKMSKSRGNVVDPFVLADRYGPDAIRYFLLREAMFGSDFSFSDEKIHGRYVSDLGNDLGNLVRRTLAMLAKYREGRIPEIPADSTFATVAPELGIRVREAFLSLRFREGLESIWDFVGRLNRDVDQKKPWDLAKRNADAELNILLYELCEGLRLTSVLIEPVLPSIARAIWTQLGLAGEPIGSWDDLLRFGGLTPGTQTTVGDPLFPRLEDAVADTVPVA